MGTTPMGCNRTYQASKTGIPKRSTLAVLGAIVFQAGLLQAQNLIPNPGFEDHRRCPGALGNLEADVLSWTVPSQGSTDYFHACSDAMGTPANFNGQQVPVEGDGYAGFYAYAPNSYREYLQARLIRPLKAGRKYRFSAAFSLSERSDYALSSLGLLFSNKPLREDTRQVLSRKRWYAHPDHEYHYLELGEPDALSNRRGWGRISVEFTAEGSERFLVIGNFNSDTDTRLRPTGRNSNKGAYYYLDDLSLRPTGSRQPESLEGYPAESEAVTFALDSLQTLPALLFEFDSFVLSGEGRARLELLSHFLRDRPRLQLELRGHTDSLGREPYNQKLSEARCRAVADFLSDTGLPASRIRYKGFGSAQPVATNSGPSGRLRNRRVEFIIHSGPAPKK